MCLKPLYRTAAQPTASGAVRRFYWPVCLVANFDALEVFMVAFSEPELKNRVCLSHERLSLQSSSAPPNPGTWGERQRKDEPSHVLAPQTSLSPELKRTKPSCISDDKVRFMAQKWGIWCRRHHRRQTPLNPSEGLNNRALLNASSV